MKAKFILHGGFTPSALQENDSFFGEVLKDAPAEAKILLVYFAKENDRVEKNKNEDIVQFNKNKGSKKLLFDVANENSFLEQVKVADIIYLHGGKSVKILETLKKFSGLGDLFESKIIAADSAGVNVLSAYFYSKTAGGVFKGLDILPIKIMCHYVSGMPEELLKETAPELETVFIPEYAYKVIYMDDGKLSKV